MRRLFAMLAAGLLAASASSGCGGGTPIAAVDLSLAITLGAQEVAPGQGFPLTIVRVWSKNLAPEEWSDRSLAPLVLRLEGTSRREDEVRVEETRRYRGYAFTLTDVAMPGPKWKATPKGGGPDRVARAQPIRLRVKPALDPASPGPPELPGEPIAERAARWPYVAGLGIAIVALAVLLQGRRRRRLSVPPSEPAPTPTRLADPSADALERLARIEGRPAPDLDAMRAAFAEVATVLRDYLANRFDVHAGEMTTEETVAAARAAPSIASASGAGLAALLRTCDRVKFAAHAPTAPERSALLRDAGAWIRETRRSSAQGLREPESSERGDAR